MKKLSLNDYNQIRAWMYRNARPIELAKWKYYIECGSIDDIVDILELNNQMLSKEIMYGIY